MQPFALDRADASPHPFDMAAPGKSPQAPASEREAKLAQALRANLRRRKAVDRPEPQDKPSDRTEG
ncbi:hypothetical protein DJ021_14295 [Phenylobacterium hankyongense]|uniref:Uncharacterized protein n=1 Tax=Phenylobacterium hankyongense TaxID=1813876 RepID=A0A328B260_9CAUL|nr:hypothetical protein DJ021_14295 [Phenylobacterium hankyongense]